MARLKNRLTLYRCTRWILQELWKETRMHHLLLIAPSVLPPRDKGMQLCRMLGIPNRFPLRLCKPLFRDALT